jgi:dihydroxy-acid dehydratase
LAIAGRVGIELDLNDWDTFGRNVPTLADLMPSGRFLMEDFCYAGGVPALMKQIADLLDLGVITANGKTLGENIANAEVFNHEVIRTRANPLAGEGGLVVLRGNLAPNGAVLKPSAASAHLLQHSGRAVVFENIEDYRNRVDDPGLDVDASCVLVLKNCGPKGYPGMPEVGNMALPKKILARGVRDMVRVSDARMSGTAFGTVVLHAAPEAAVGGPLALIQDGDVIQLDVQKRLLAHNVDDAELARRRARWTPPQHEMQGGYQSLYREHVLQADRGADFDFLVGCRGAAVPRESH